MATELALREKFGLNLSHNAPGAGDSYRRALASVAAVLADETVEAHAAWFDRGSANLEIGVHLRLVTPTGVIALDHDFSLDGSPDARFMPWSQVTQLTAIADSPEGASFIIIRNSWLETKVGRIEFAGVDSAEEHAVLVRAIRQHLR